MAKKYRSADGTVAGKGSDAPDLEGVFAIAATREDVEARMAAAVGAHLQALRDLGHPVPEPRTEAGHVAA